MRQIWIGALALLTGAAATAGIGFKGPGNATVFPVADAAKAVTLHRLTGAAEWTVYDFWQHPVARGALKSGESTLTLPLAEPGYYRLVVRSGQETAETGIAVVAPPPALRKDSPFGINSHFAQGWETSLIPLIRAAGFSWIRDGLEWQSVEPRKGEFDFNFEVAKRVLKASEALHVVYCLSYGNQYYDQRSAPVTPDGIAGWKRFVGATAGAFPAVDTFETWNEYNCGFNMFDKVRPTAENYMLLLKATRAQLKQSRPQAELMGCSATTLPFEWLEEVFALGGLDYMDSVSVHPYRWGEWQRMPETLYPDLLRLRQLVDKYAKGRHVPIHTTELGWPVDWKYRISEAKQAAYIVRTYANLQRAGVDKVLWYCFMKPPQDPELFAIGELILPEWNYTPRPGYAAIAAMTHAVGDLDYAGEVAVPAPALCMKYQKGGRTVHLLWNPETKPVTLAVASGRPVTLTDLMGGRHVLTPVDGRVQLVLAQMPVYLEGEIGAVSLSTAVTASPAAMQTAVNTPFRFRLDGEAGFSLAVDGREYAAGQSVLLEGNDSIGSRNAIGDFRRGGVTCGFFCLSYDVLTQLSLAGVQLLPAQQQIRVDIDNILPLQFQKITGFAGTFAGAPLPAPTLDRLAITPVTTLLLPFRKEVKPYDLKPLVLRFDFSSHPSLSHEGMLGNNPCFYRKDITIDGEVGEWRNQPCIDLRAQGKYVPAFGEPDPGPQNFNGKVWVAWDDNRFYLAAEITDPTHHQVFPVWQGDSLQVGIGKLFPADSDTSIEAEISFSSQNGDCWVFPGRTPLGFDGGAIRQYSEPRMKHTGNRSTYEVAIPWDKIRFIGPGDGAFRFSILVNNNNGTGRLGWLEWGSGIGSGKDPALYPVMTFVK